MMSEIFDLENADASNQTLNWRRWWSEFLKNILFHTILLRTPKKADCLPSNLRSSNSGFFCIWPI